MEISREERGVVLSIGDNVLFDTGSAALKKSAGQAIAAVADALVKLPNKVVIEGHTDNVPVSEHRKPYTSNWDLSRTRATQVLSYLLQTFGLPPERFSAAGYAEYRPKATNATPEGRAKNRRVDIIILTRNGK